MQCDVLCSTYHLNALTTTHEEVVHIKDFSETIPEDKSGNGIECIPVWSKEKVTRFNLCQVPCGNVTSEAPVVSEDLLVSSIFCPLLFCSDVVVDYLYQNRIYNFFIVQLLLT
ncbi:hypothetical protein AMECASPLE_004124 [Ameca splendens]|uniref:Uncharacterized protein n=1 Tax=Ameca splendens TaxID=208324 RepID=A0ABV0Y9U3_9TELE